jgi:hypothetical protein
MARRKAAARELRELERMQPTAQSGGQEGIQDQVCIITPDGTRYRFMPSQVGLEKFSQDWYFVYNYEIIEKIFGTFHIFIIARSLIIFIAARYEQ